MFYFAVCCTRCPCHCLHAWVISHRLGLPSLRFYAVGSSLFLLSVCFLFMFSIFSRRCPLLATSCPSFFCLLTMLISDSRFDLVWFRLSCDHGWIRSGSVNVRKQQQQQVRCICFCVVLFLFCFCLFLFMLVSWGGCDKISLVVIARIKLFGLMRGAYIF